MNRIIAITGGIGSGKSIVSRILTANGYDVYDCDREAKLIMDSNPAIHRQLIEQIHPQAVINNRIDRPLIAQIVFNDSQKLHALNAIVHQAVVNDILAKASMPRYNNILFVETAILYQSNLDLVVHAAWHVTAPRETRIQRVMKRNACTCDDVEARINAQENFTPERQHPCVRTITNDGITPVLPQVLERLKAEQ